MNQQPVLRQKPSRNEMRLILDCALRGTSSQAGAQVVLDAMAYFEALWQYTDQQAPAPLPPAPGTE